MVSLAKQDHGKRMGAKYGFMITRLVEANGWRQKAQRISTSYVTIALVMRRHVLTEGSDRYHRERGNLVVVPEPSMQINHAISPSKTFAASFPKLFEANGESPVRTYRS
jgi:hypothetical protein